MLETFYIFITSTVLVIANVSTRIINICGDMGQPCLTHILISGCVVVHLVYKIVLLNILL